MVIIAQSVRAYKVILIYIVIHSIRYHDFYVVNMSYWFMFNGHL